MSFDEITTPEELFKFMSENISYGFVDNDGNKYTNMDDWLEKCIVQSGEEVLKSKIGTCWDQVELERLWFSKHNYNFKTIFCWFYVCRENSLPTHTFLVYEENGKWYWFENSFWDARGIHGYSSLKELFEDVKEKQYQYVLNNQMGIREDEKDTLLFYEYDEPRYHLGVEEYIKFITSNKIK